MATETDRPFYESFDNGVGALNHTFGGSIDTSVRGEVRLNGYAGMMEFPGGNSAGHGYGTYTVEAKLDGSEHGPAVLLWPGNDQWPGQEIDLVELLPGGRQYGTVHWNDNGDSYVARMFDGVSGGQFHDYTVVWEPGRITFKVDGAEKGTVTNNVPTDYDAGGMNNAISLLNTSNNTTLTVRDIEYQPLGGSEPARSEPVYASVSEPARSEPTPSAPASSGGGGYASMEAAAAALGWDFVAAQVSANYAATGEWFF